MRASSILSVALALACTDAARAEDGLPFPGPAIAPTVAHAAADQLTIGNNVLTARFVRDGKSLRLASVSSPLNGVDLAWSDPNLFTVYAGDPAKPLASSAMKMVGEPAVVPLKPMPGAARLSDRLPGQALVATFVDESAGLAVQWRAMMTDGANYLRQEVRLRAIRMPLAVDRVETVKAEVPGARVAGYTDGAPLVTDQLFLGLEHPMARNAVPSGDGWTPAEMQARSFTIPLRAVAAGEVQVRFDYKRGNHRIDVAQVELLGADGGVVAEDAHAGFSGIKVSENVYRIKAPAALASASLRVTLGGAANETDSWGAITVTGATPAAAGRVECSLPRRCTLETNAVWTVSTGIGVYPPGQQRRAFLYYVERERAHPYRQYWHYNSWYDLNIDRNDNPDPMKRMTEAQCLQVIRAFGLELYERRKVGLDGFVWDDGWDDWNTLWGFHAGFPRGFTALKEEAAKQGAGMGAWLSPWGGYGGSHDMRVRFGRANGYETNPGGFSLGGPRYFAAFRDVCLKMIREYNQTYFKFDGIGGGTFATGAPTGIAPDLDGLVRLLAELRRANPQVFINCTVGTWASPYWTWFADSVWRQGGDCDFAGEGNPRERWITYRDGILHSRFAETSPLYPLNSMMYHGLLVGPRAAPARMPTPAKDIESYRHEVLMSVACGSGLGELYVTPELMTPDAWDILAAGLTWSRARRDVLRDTHWVGGKPGSDVYGYAAWHPAQGATLVIRNPTQRDQTFTLDPQRVWELPAGAPATWRLVQALAPDAQAAAARASGHAPLQITLRPFEVKVFDATPEKDS